MEKPIDDFTKFAKVIQNIHITNVLKFRCEQLKDYTYNSEFFFFNEKMNDLEKLLEHFNTIKSPVPIVFYYFMNDFENYDNQNDNIFNYLLLYTNKAGIIYDLILGPENLTSLFTSLYKIKKMNSFCLVSMHKQDQEYLNDLIDLSHNYFLNSSIISSKYESHQLHSIVEKISNEFKQNLSIKNDLSNYIEIYFTLIVYYIPLISIVSDKYSLNPYDHYQHFPKRSSDDFIRISDLYSNSFQNSSLYLHINSFEFYIINSMQKISSIEYKIEYEFYRQLYGISDIPFLVPCYGYFQDKNIREGFLFKFMCNGRLPDSSKYFGEDDSISKYWSNTQKMMNMYRILASIASMHESGYYLRNLKPDHIFLDRNNNAYLGGLSTLCSNDNTDNNQLGSQIYISPEQYCDNKSSPLSDVYSFASSTFQMITGRYFIKNGNLQTEYENINKIYKECFHENPKERPNSLFLFILIHKKKLYLPGTNEFLMDSLFKEVFSYYLRNHKIHGVYMSSWSKSLENNPFHDLIFKCLPLTFIINYDKSDFEADLNLYLGEDIFNINYENEDIFKINFFANKLNNKFLINETESLIRVIPKPAQIISRIKLYNSLESFSDNDNEKKMISELKEEEKKEFGQNFDDCICCIIWIKEEKKAQDDISHDFYRVPSFILSIMDEQNLKFEDPHNTIKYLINVSKKVNEEDYENTLVPILKHFKSDKKKFLYSDLSELNSVFNTKVFTEEFLSETSSKTVDLEINENNGILDKVNETLKNLETELHSMDEQISEINECIIEDLSNKYGSMLENLDDFNKNQFLINYFLDNSKKKFI